MRVLLLSTDAGGSKFYRFTAPADAVIKNFPEIDVRIDHHVSIQGSLDSKTGITTVSEVEEDVDLIVVQRPLAQDMNALILQAKKQGIATAVEIDDDFESVHPRNIAYRYIQPKYNKMNNKLWLRKSISDADFLITSTRPLLDSYSHGGHGAVLPNFVPERILEITAPRLTSTTVGWTGTVQTHPTDLEVTDGAIGTVLKKTGARFHTVGDGNIVGTKLKLDYDAKISASGWVDFEKYYHEIKSNIDVGIVPLDDIPFNHAKSRLKGLEFAGLGIPFIVSPTHDYIELSKFNIGEIAQTPTEWNKKLQKLVVDGRRRSSLGQRYRDIVRDSFTYEGNAKLWVNAWQRAIDVRRVSR